MAHLRTIKTVNAIAPRGALAVTDGLWPVDLPGGREPAEALF